MRYRRGIITWLKLLILSMVLGITVWADAPATGEERAPGFSLPSQDSRRVALEEFRGKKAVVLFFQEGPG